MPATESRQSGIGKVRARFQQLLMDPDQVPLAGSVKIEDLPTVGLCLLRCNYLSKRVEWGESLLWLSVLKWASQWAGMKLGLSGSMAVKWHNILFRNRGKHRAG
jgi:hypothetical protein